MADDSKKTPSALGKQVRSQIQQTIEQQTEERRRDLFKQRLELARQGVSKYHEHEVGKSATNFQSYIRILEEWKGVPEGSLRPSHFDPRKEVAEVLLLSGVYWDLVKLFDRTKSDEKRKLFLHYMSQFIVFSKGLPHQQLSAETIRKYVSNGKPVHVEDFRNAYRALNKSKCFVASELFELVDDEAFEAWRAFRDGRLSATRAGRAVVATYYRVGPVVARGLARAPAPARRLAALALNRAARHL